jgi:hypothetical protein
MEERPIGAPFLTLWLDFFLFDDGWVVIQTPNRVNADPTTNPVRAAVLRDKVDMDIMTDNCFDLYYYVAMIEFLLCPFSRER